MFKTIIIFGFLSLAVVSNSFASDSDRIDQLEKDLQETKLRLLKLESLLIKPSNVQKPAASSEGWKSKPNWRKLTKELNPSEVQSLLGEPQNVRGGNFTIWDYQNGGRVVFYEGKVYQWAEPQF